MQRGEECLKGGTKQEAAFILLFFFKSSPKALGGVAKWIECQPANQRVTSLIPSQGTCLGCRPGPQCGVCKRQQDIDVFLPLFLLLFPSFSKKGIKSMFIDIWRKRKGEGGKKRGRKHQCVVAFCMPLSGDLAHNPGMCPDWGSNR